MANALSDFTQLSQAFGNMANSLIGLMNVKVETEVNRRQAEIGKLQTDFLMRLSLPPGSEGRISSVNFQAEFDALNANTQQYIDSVDDGMVRGKVQNILSSGSNAFKLKVAEKYGEALYNEAMNNYFVTNSIEYQQAPAGEKEKTASRLLEWGRANMDPSQFKKYEHELLTKAKADDAYGRAISSGKDLVDASVDEQAKMDQASKEALGAMVTATTKAEDSNIDKVMEDNKKALDAGTKAVAPLLQAVLENKNLSKEKKRAVVGELMFYQAQNESREVGDKILEIGKSSGKWRSRDQIVKARGYIDEKRAQAQKDFGDIPEPMLKALERAEDEVDTWEREAAEQTKVTEDDLWKEWNGLVAKYNAGQISGFQLMSHIYNNVNPVSGSLANRFKEQVLDKSIITSEVHRKALTELGPMFKSVAEAVSKSKNGMIPGFEFAFSKEAQEYIRKNSAQFQSDLQEMMVSAEARYISGNLKDIGLVKQDVAKYMLVYAETMGKVGTIIKTGLKGNEGKVGEVLGIAEGSLGKDIGFNLFENKNIYGVERGKIGSLTTVEEQVRDFGIDMVEGIINSETLPPDALAAFKSTMGGSGKLVESEDTNRSMDTAFESADGRFRIDINSRPGGVQAILSRRENGKWTEVGPIQGKPASNVRIYTDPVNPENTSYQEWDGTTWKNIDKKKYDELLRMKSGSTSGEFSPLNLPGF